METGQFRRNTRQRQVILDELRGITSHPTAADLYQMVRQYLPKISLGTVYRNLELLAEIGEIQKVEIAGLEARFDGNASVHHHVRCESCGKVDDLDEVPGGLGDFVASSRFSHPNGYEILGYHLVFSGRCPACRKPGGAATSESESQDVRMTGGSKQVPHPTSGEGDLS